MAGEVLNSDNTANHRNEGDADKPIPPPPSRNGKKTKKAKLSEQFKNNLFYDILGPEKMQVRPEGGNRQEEKRSRMKNRNTSEGRIRSNNIRKSSSAGGLLHFDDYDVPVGGPREVIPQNSRKPSQGPKKLRKASSAGELRRDNRPSKIESTLPPKARSRRSVSTVSSYVVEKPDVPPQKNHRKSLLSKLFRIGGSNRSLSSSKSRSCGDLQDLTQQKSSRRSIQETAQPTNPRNTMGTRQGSSRSLQNQGKPSRPVRSCSRVPQNQNRRRKERGGDQNLNPSDLRHYGNDFRVPTKQRQLRRAGSCSNLRTSDYPPPPPRRLGRRGASSRELYVPPPSGTPRKSSSLGDLKSTEFCASNKPKRNDTGYSLRSNQLTAAVHDPKETTTTQAPLGKSRKKTSGDSARPRRDRGTRTPREKVFLGMQISVDKDYDWSSSSSDCSSSSSCGGILEAPKNIEAAQRRLDEIETEKQAELSHMRKAFEAEKKAAEERFQKQMELLSQGPSLEDLEKERNELENERRELEATLRELASDVASIRVENEILEKDNADQYDVFQMLGQYVKKETAKRQKLVSTEHKIKQVYDGSVALITGEKVKLVYRGGMYKCARGVQMSEKYDHELYEDVMKLVTDTESELGCDVHDLHNLDELREERDAFDFNSSIGEKLFAISEETDSQVDDFLEKSYRLKEGETTNDQYDQIDEEIQDCTGVVSGISCQMEDMTTLYENKEILFTIFTLLDKDGNGELDRTEFQVGISLLNRRLPQESQFKNHVTLFEALDADNNGTIDLAEFAQIFNLNGGISTS